VVEAGPARTKCGRTDQRVNGPVYTTTHGGHCTKAATPHQYLWAGSIGRWRETRQEPSGPRPQWRLDLNSTNTQTNLPAAHPAPLAGKLSLALLNHWRDAFFVDYRDVAHPNPLLSILYFITGLGHQWVIVFFVMSGFLVGGSVLRAFDAGRWSWRSYLLTRMTRLYVVLLPALVLGGVLDWAGMHLQNTGSVYSGQSGMHSLTVDVQDTLTPRALLANTAFLQTITLPGASGKVPTFGSNGPLWSLSYEFWYYLAFPPLVLLLGRSRSIGIRILCVAVLVGWGWFVGSEIALLGISWLMGVLIGQLPAVSINRNAAKALALAAALGLWVAAMMYDKSRPGIASDLLLAVPVTLLIWVILHCSSGRLPRWYAHAAQRAARSSYTTYLVHYPLLVFFKAALHLPRASIGELSVLTGVAVLLAVVLYAQVVYELFEKNTDRLRNWIKPLVLGRSAG